MISDKTKSYVLCPQGMFYAKKIVRILNFSFLFVGIFGMNQEFYRLCICQQIFVLSPNIAKYTDVVRPEVSCKKDAPVLRCFLFHLKILFRSQDI